MKTERLLDLIGKIDDNLIYDAVHDVPKNRFSWVKWAGMAATFGICVILGLSVGFKENTKDKDTLNYDTLGGTDSIGVENGEDLQVGNGSIIPGGNTIPVEESSGAMQAETFRPAILPPQENSKSEEPSLNVESVQAAPLAPERKVMTLDEIYHQMDLYLPPNAPDGFGFEEAYFSEGSYHIRWSKGMDELDWVIRKYTKEDASCITTVSEIENYDLSLYPIPRAESVPDELRQIVDNPIFYLEELTQDAVNARAYLSGEAGDSEGYRMKFSVLCGEKVITVRSKGISPEWMYTNLSGLGQ